MEFKVWMDGIQRVVCGVSYNTTCQEVVIALASAMGRTGHFTLVEKWRDTERSLLSAECPLRSLQKRGEYSGEVRYYLVQAETDISEEQEKNNQKMNVPTHQKHRLLHNITPHETLSNHLHSLKSELVKRSSTFSGAHISAYETLPSSLTESSSSPLSCDKQTVVSPSSMCTAGEYHLEFTPASKGKLVDMSPTSINSSLKSLSKSTKDTHKRHTPRETSSEPILNTSVTFSGDVRGLHPVIRSKVLSSHCSPLSSHTQYPSKHNLVPSEQLVSLYQSQHPSLGQPLQPLTSTSKPDYLSSAIENHQTAMTATSPSCHSQISPSSECPYLRNKQSYQQICPTPAPRRKIVMSSTIVDQEGIQYSQKFPQQMEKLHDPNLECLPVCFSKTASSCGRSFSAGTEDNAQNIARRNISGNYQTESGQEETILHPSQSSRTEITRGYHHFSQNIILQTLNSCDKNIQRRLKSNIISESSTDNKKDVFFPATLNRSSRRPRSEIFNINLSADIENEQRRSKERQLLMQKSTSDLDKFQQNDEDKKLKTMSSTFLKQKVFDTDGNNNGTISTFASAVAQISQHKEDALFKYSKEGTHVRQHSLDSSKIDASFKGGLTRIANMVSVLQKDFVDNVNSSTNILSSDQQCRDHLLQQSNKPSLSSPWHNSEALSKPNRHESSDFPAHASEACNTVKLNGKLRDFNCLYGNNSTSHPKKDSSYSRQDSLDIQECNLDKSSSDVLKRDTADGRRAKGGPQSSRLTENVLEIDVRQEDNGYSQLLRMVKMQQEKIKIQETHLRDTNLEITKLEDEESIGKAKLKEIFQDIFCFETHEVHFKKELENLDKTEWISVLDNEKKLEAVVKLQIEGLKVKLKQVESQIQQLKEEENQKSKDLKSREERTNKEKEENEELGRKVILETKYLEDQLTSLCITIDQNNQKMKDMEREILKEDTDLIQKERVVKSLEEELHDETTKLFHNSEHPIIPVSAVSNTVLQISASGEAILKILEGRLSAHSSPASTSFEVDNLGGVISAQHLHKSAMTVINSSGVWV